MIKTFRLKKEYPGHNIGDILYKTDEFYEWNIEPYYNVSSELVEKFSDFFEEVCNNFKKGEFIFYISVSGEIIDEIFEPSRHSALVYFGNCFKTEEEVTWYRDKISLLLNDTDSLVINKKELVKISYILNEDIELAKTLIQKFI